MSQQLDEAAVHEYLEGLGRAETSARVVQAFRADKLDGSTWVLELQSMELDGELDAFLDACTANAGQDEAASTSVADTTLDHGPSDDAGGQGGEAVAGSSTLSEPPRDADEVDKSVDIDAVATAVELAAEVALQTGSVGEEIFSVSGAVKGKKKARDMQLKVGQMSLQLFHGGVLLDSWRYPDLGGWEFTREEGEEKGTLTLELGPNNRGDEDLEFVCSDEVGTRCCELMMQHATVMHQEEKRKQEVEIQKKREEKQKMLDALRGKYTVSQHCLLLREAASLDSPQIGIVESGEAVTVVDAVNIEGRIRVHVVADGLKMRNSSDSQLASIDGWGSWKSGSGARLLLERLPRNPKRETLNGAGRRHGGTMQYCLGDYLTEQADGVVVQATKYLESDELCTIAPGQHVQAVEASFVGERLRLRVKSDLVNLVAEPGQPDHGAVDGWVSLRDTAGTSMLVKTDSAVEASDDETTTDEDNSEDGGDNFQPDDLPPVVFSQVLQGSIQDQIDDALSATCQDLDGINLVLERVAVKKYSHPSVRALQAKALSLQEQASDNSGGPRPKSTSIASRRMSVAEEGVGSVVDLAGQAAAESGGIGEKMFDVTMPNSGRKPGIKCQLKVSQMGVQVFDGPQVLDSWLYANLSAWEFRAGKRVLVLVIADKPAGAAASKARAASKKKTQEFGCTDADGAEICGLMTDHAVAMVKQQRSAMKKHLVDLCGKYTVTTQNGVLMRGRAATDSYKVGIVATSEEVEVIEAVQIAGRFRLHAIGSNIHMDDGSRQDVDGWISLKNAAGTALVVKSDTVPGAIASHKSRRPSPPKQSRLQSLRRHSVAFGAKSSPPGPTSPRQGDKNLQHSRSFSRTSPSNLEIQVKQTHIEHVQEQVALRCEPLALRLMNKAQCVSAIPYRNLTEWQVISSSHNSAKKLELTLRNGDIIALQCVRPGDAEKVSLEMTKFAEKLASQPSTRAVRTSSPSRTQPRRERSHTASGAQGAQSMRRASIAIDSGMSGVTKNRKAFIKNSAYMSQSDDGEKNSFVAKQKSPKLCDVTLTLHTFGLQVSPHSDRERRTTYTYDRIPSWKLLPNGDISLKILSLEGGIEIFNYATGDAQQICELLTQFHGAEPSTPTALQHGHGHEKEEVVEPGDRFECVNVCVLTAEWERTSDQTGKVAVGQVVEVAEATLNHQKQWRMRVSRVWNDSTCTVSVPSLEAGWVSLKKIDGEPNFLPIGGEQEQAAQPISTAGQHTESAYWRETRLLEEAEQRARGTVDRDHTSNVVPEPIRKAKKMLKPSTSGTEKPSNASDSGASPSIVDSQGLEDPVSPRFLQDSTSAVAESDDRSADEKLRLQQQFAAQQADQQRKIASLEMQIVDLHKQLATQTSGDARQLKVEELELAVDKTEAAVRDDPEDSDSELKRCLHAAQEAVLAKEQEVTSLNRELQMACERSNSAEVRNEQLLRQIADLRQAMVEQQDARQSGDVDRIAELEAAGVLSERCVQMLSEELDKSIVVMGTHHEKVHQLTVAHQSAVDQIGIAEQQRSQLEKCIEDQEFQIREIESQKQELERLRLQHNISQEQNQADMQRQLEAQLSILEARVADEQAAKISLRRDNAELKIQVQALQMERKSSPSRVPPQESAREELAASKSRAHEAALEIEALRIDLARSRRLVSEAEGREAKAKALTVGANRRVDQVTQELQTATDEIKMQRGLVSKLKEQMAAMDAASSPDARAAMLQQELDTSRADLTALNMKLETEVVLREELESEKEGLSRNLSASDEARKHLEEEARAGWEKADQEARLRQDALNDKRAEKQAMEAKVDELTRDVKKQQSLLDTTMQRLDDSQRKVKAEAERSHAAELNAQHVASRARAASAEMRANMVDIQSTYEKQLSAIRAEKAKLEVAYDLAVQERQRLQEWVHEHMTATQERLLNSSAAVEASEKARVELQPRLEKANREVRRLQGQLRELARESARAQQAAASQVKHLRSESQAERERLESQIAEMSTELEEQRKKFVVERDRREAVDRRVESELEAARVAEQNAAHAIRDAKADFGTTLEHAEMQIARIHQEEIDSLRLANAKLVGQLDHSVREKSQLQATIQALEAQHEGHDAAVLSREKSSTLGAVDSESAVDDSSRESDTKVKQAQAHLKEVQERHALQMSKWRTTSREAQIDEAARFVTSSPRSGASLLSAGASPSEGIPPRTLAHGPLAIASDSGDISGDPVNQGQPEVMKSNAQVAEDYSQRLDFLMDSLVNNLSPRAQNRMRDDSTRNGGAESSIPSEFLRSDE